MLLRLLHTYHENPKLSWTRSVDPGGCCMPEAGNAEPESSNSKSVGLIVGNVAVTTGCSVRAVARQEKTTRESAQVLDTM